MSLKELFEIVMRNYVKARTSEPFKGNRMGDVFRREIPQEIKNYDFIDTDKYIVNGSCGKGNWAEVPWIAIMKKDVTTTTMQGIYIVYLFSNTMDRLYLTLNQGCTRLINERGRKGAIEYMQNLAIKLRAEVNVSGWNKDDNLVIGNEFYEKGTIFYRLYERGKLPDDEVIKADLKDLIQIYEACIQKLNEQPQQKQIGDSTYMENRTSIDLPYYNVSGELQRIKDYIKSRGFQYEDRVVEDFYLSLKSKPFVILAGISGTGKSRFARLFAESIGCTSYNGRFKLVPVKPDWSDSTDLLGYKDLNNKFHPGILTTFIKKAISDPVHPYFFVLDEMNLARVEYYFSDVLSIIESRVFKGDRIITDPLLNDELLSSGDQELYQEYKGLYIPDNVYFIGTVNMDETTFPFSKKVLDRANVIEFSDVILNYNFDQPNDTEVRELNNKFLKSEFLQLNDCADYAEYVEGVIDLLSDINQVLKYGNLHFGYRVRDEICFYIIYNKIYGIMSFEEAMDFMILQKVLPRIQGSSMTLKKILIELFKICSGNMEERFNYEDIDISKTMIDEIENADIRFRKSAVKMAYMTRRYDEDGFTSYWI